MKPGGQPVWRLPEEVPSSVLFSQPPVPHGGIVIPHTQTTGGDMWVPRRWACLRELGLNKGTCSLQQESDYAGSTSEEGLRGLYHGDSRILIEIRDAIFASPERTWGLQASQWWAAGTLRNQPLLTFLSTAVPSSLMPRPTIPNWGSRERDLTLGQKLQHTSLVCFWFSITLV